VLATGTEVGIRISLESLPGLIRPIGRTGITQERFARSHDAFISEFRRVPLSVKVK
jgi:hypothetical protein